MDDIAILDRLGGRIKIDELVEDVYFRILNDKRLSRFFRNVNTVQLMQHQGIFLTILFSSKGRLDETVLDSLQRTHKHVGVTDQHFDVFIAHLTESVRAFNIDGPTIQKVSASLEQLRPCFIPTKKSSQQSADEKIAESKSGNKALRRFLQKAAAQGPASNTKMVEV